MDLYIKKESKSNRFLYCKNIEYYRLKSKFEYYKNRCKLCGFKEAVPSTKQNSFSSLY